MSEYKKIIMCSLLMILIIISSTILCGCSVNNDTNRDYTTEILNYLGEKYPDDTFSVGASYGGSLGAQTVHKFYVKSKNLNRDDITVMVSTKDPDAWKFSDNYIPLKYEKQTKEYIHKCYADFFGSDVIVNYKVDIDACADNVSFEEYLKKYLKSGVVMAHRNGHELEPSLINETADFLKARNCRCAASIFIVDDSIDLNNYTLDNYSTINKYYVDYYFCHNEDFSISNSDWEVKWTLTTP